MKTLSCRALALAGGLVMLSAQAAAQDRAVPLAIAKKPVGKALQELAAKTGANILFTPAAVAGMRSAPVRATVTAEQGARKMLAGTGLQVIRDQNGALLIQPQETRPPRVGLNQPAPRREEPMRYVAVQLAAPNSLGQVAKQSELAADENAQHATDIPEIIVTAQRRNERLEDVPVSVSTISGESLVAAGVASTRDIGQVFPGVNINQIGAYSSPNIRAIGSTLTGPGADNSVATYFDGIYLTSQPGLIFNLPDINRIEVAKGPQGTLFGRNATGGAIQIFTRDPEFDFTGLARATLGTLGRGSVTHSLEGFFTGPISESLAASLSLSEQGSNGYARNLTSDRRLGGQSESVHGKLLYTASDQLKFEASLLYSRRNDDYAQAGKPLKGNTVGVLIDPTLSFSKDHYRFNLDLEPYLIVENIIGSFRGTLTTSAGTLTSLTAFVRNRVKRNSSDVDASPVTAAHYLVPQFDNSFVQEITFTSVQMGALSYIAGANYYHDHSAIDPLTIVGFATLYNGSKTDAYGIFAEATLQATNRLKAIAGVRYSGERKIYDGGLPTPIFRVGKKSFHDVSPRASLVYELADRTNAYFTYSRGFKSGLFNNFSFSPVPVRPETISAFELGLKTASRRFSANAAIFYYDYKDLQVSVLSNIVDLPVTQNAASARLIGVEGDATLRLIEGLTLRAGFSWLPEAKYLKYPGAAANVPTGQGGNQSVSVIASGFRMIRAPKFTANANIEYERSLPGGNLTFNISAFYTDSFNMELLGRIKQSSYVTLNSSAFWSPNGSRFKFGVYGKNLTNEKNIFQLTTFGPSGDEINYALPREIGLSITRYF